MDSDKESESAQIFDFTAYRNEKLARENQYGLRDFIDTFSGGLSEEDNKEVSLAVETSVKANDPANIIMELALVEPINIKRFMMLARFSKVIMENAAKEFGFDAEKADVVAGVYFDSLGQILNATLAPKDKR